MCFSINLMYCCSYARRLKTADFPVHLLPKVVEVPSLAGTLQMDWHNIPQETLVGIAMGDLQCSILATNPSISDASTN